MSATEVVLLLVMLAGFVVLAVMVWLRRPEPVLPRVAELEKRLAADFQRATADMAGRMAGLEGTMLAKLGTQLQAEARESRSEQAQHLRKLADTLERKFEALSESQSVAARNARQELAQSLDSATSKLQQRFEGLEQKTSGNLEAIRAKVDERLQSISEQVQAKLSENIKEGFKHFEAVQNHLKAAEEQLRNVRAVGTSINELSALLKLPHLRGKFGEAELSRLLADFLPAAAFEEQVPVASGSRELVDAVVKFPNFKLPIDSKFNRESVLPLFETNDPAMLAEARRKLALAIKAQAKDIADKYIRPEHGTTDLALMFLPSETLYFEVIRDGELLAAIHKLKVFPVSPNTLVIALRSIAMSISQYEAAKNVEKTLDQIRLAQKHFGSFQASFERVGDGLQKAQDAYQKATSHLTYFSNRVVRLTGEVPSELPTGESASGTVGPGVGPAPA